MDLPSDDALRWIVRAYARFRAAHGNAIGEPVLVHPTGEFFPDEFHRDAESVARLLRRIMTYAPIAEDVCVGLEFLSPEEQPPGGCGSSACGSSVASGPRSGSIDEVDGGYRVFVAAADVSHPEVLTASLVRSVGAIVLSEAGAEVGHVSAPTAEIAAAACGFGKLLAIGAAVWGKSCGGLRLACGTALSVEETTLTLALFVATHSLKPSEARANLQATQREAFDQAIAWVESNPLLVESLRDRPARLEGGAFDIEPVRGLLGRWLHRRKIDQELLARPVSPPRSSEQKRRFEEARALVDEALGDD
ncbi:MAG: hypothetical protein M3O46_00635 [Myxococcota bacterium]|nr:hypothetical protein [Myxococcota bacterium]